MAAETENFTPAEVAVIAGVSVRDVHRMIDEHIMPERFFSTTQTRFFQGQACVFVSFYFGAADRLTAEERQRTIVLASTVSDFTRESIVKDGFLTIDLSSFSRGVEERMKLLRLARDLVVVDPEILGGMAVVKGTRIGVYDVAASVKSGIAMDQILGSYPSLTREEVELAALFAEANPLRGRPRQRVDLPAGTVVVAQRRRLLQPSV